jgi:hypothetical protein
VGVARRLVSGRGGGSPFIDRSVHVVGRGRVLQRGLAAGGLQRRAAGGSGGVASRRGRAEQARPGRLLAVVPVAGCEAQVAFLSVCLVFVRASGQQDSRCRSRTCLLLSCRLRLAHELNSFRVKQPEIGGEAGGVGADRRVRRQGQGGQRGGPAAGGLVDVAQVRAEAHQGLPLPAVCISVCLSVCGRTSITVTIIAGLIRSG